uniref:C2H2-type domain-containing protein n=1 Tax=Anopheles farauti TaxID=69004 RepID=A0A182QT12_9DIPT
MADGEDDNDGLSLFDIVWEDVLYVKLFPLLSLKDLFSLRCCSRLAKTFVDNGLGRLQEINLSGNNSPHLEEAFAVLSENCRNVRVINLARCNWLQDSILCPFLQRNRRLTKINLSDCLNITPRSMQPVIIGCKQLTTLKLSHCHWLTIGAMEALTLHHTKIQELDISHCAALNERCISVFLLNCRTLKTLSLSNVPAVTDNLLFAIAKHSKFIKNLNLVGCYTITDRGVGALALCCKELESLMVRECPHVTERSLALLRGRVFIDRPRVYQPDMNMVPNMGFPRLFLQINNNNDRSKYICPACFKVLDKGIQLKLQIRAAEKVVSTKLQSIEIENVCEQDYDFEYLEEFKDEISLEIMPQRERLLSVCDSPGTDEGEDELLAKQLNSQLAEEEIDSLEDGLREQGKFAFVMPAAELIANRIEFDDFEYLEIRGERCCGCAHIATSRDELMAHAKEKHSQNYYADSSYTCPTCYQKFPTADALEKHNQYYLYSDVFLCTICQEAFNFQSHLMLHLKACHGHVSHDDEAPEVDDETPKRRNPWKASAVEIFLPDVQFIKETRELPLYRQYTISGERCCVCRLYPTTLETHAAEKHLDLEEVLEPCPDELRCNVCKRMFNSTHDRVLHEEERRDLKQIYQCKLCNVLFTRKHLLHQLREHLNLVPEFGCEVCGKHFAARSTLVKHRRVHEPSKNLPCTFAGCEARFRDDALLRRHYRNVHTELKAYACAHCQKEFRTKESLDMHQRSHTGERPFVCRYEGCSKRYAHGTDRKRHERSSHTGERPHTCPVCGGGFLRKREMRLHMEKVH